MKIEMLPGLTPDQIARVRGAGIQTCRQLLQTSRRMHQRQALVRSTGLPREMLQSIVDRAGLTRIRGIGPTALATLLRAGVTSLAELATEDPADLQSRMRKTTSRPPNLAVIENWILQARQQTRARTDQFAPTP